MAEAQLPRWSRFSLRTLFVVVTVLCCWLAWEMSVVRQRRAELKRLEGNWAYQVTTAEEWRLRYPGGLSGQPPARVSLVRRSLGDVAIQEIGYYGHMVPEADRRRLARAFPEAKVYDLPPLLEPCHPGCFPRGTLVETPLGPRCIESIGPGDLLTVILPSGQPGTASVQSVFTTTNRLWRIETTAGVLLTTQTQPLCVAVDQTRPAGELASGDTILHWQPGGLQSVTVLNVEDTDEIVPVFNLVLGNCEVFVAGGYLARSKPPAATANLDPTTSP